MSARRASAYSAADETPDFRVDETGIAQVADAVLEGDLLGLHHYVSQFGPAERLAVVASQQVHHGQDDEALGDRRLLQELVAPVVRAQGLHPLGEGSLQVPFLEESTAFPDAGAHARRHVAPIEAVAPVTDDGLQHPGQLRLPQQPSRCEILQPLTEVPVDVGRRGRHTVRWTARGTGRAENRPGPESRRRRRPRPSPRCRTAGGAQAIRPPLRESRCSTARRSAPRPGRGS